MCIATNKQHSIKTSCDSFKEPIKSNEIPLDVSWTELEGVKYLTSGGSSNVYTANFRAMPVIIKVLKPELADDETFINEMESEISILSRLNHPHIVQLYGAGYDSKRQRFIILELLSGGTMERIFDGNSKNLRRAKKSLPLKDVVSNALAIAKAIQFLHSAIDGSTILHRDLKPDNIGFTADGALKVMDFGLASEIESTLPFSDDVYEMTGGTGSLRYMAPEVADSRPYNHKADVYSFSILLWELLSCKKPFVGLGIDEYFEKVVYNGERPSIDQKWPKELRELMTKCWDSDIEIRPNSQEIVTILESFNTNTSSSKAAPRRRLTMSNMRRRSMDYS